MKVSVLDALQRLTGKPLGVEVLDIPVIGVEQVQHIGA